MRDKDRFPSVLAFLQQAPGQTVTVHLAKRPTPNHQFMAAAHVASIPDLYRVLRRLGREDPRIECVSNDNSISLAFYDPTFMKPGDSIAAAPKLLPPVQSDETVLADIIEPNEENTYEPAPFKETSQPFKVIPTTTIVYEARTPKLKLVAAPKAVRKPRTPQSRPKPPAEARMPVRRPHLALVKPHVAKQPNTTNPLLDEKQQHALNNYKDLVACAPSNFARSYWQAEVDKLLNS